MSGLNQLANAVYEGDLAGVKEITQQLIDSGITPLEIINEGLIGGMNIVAPKFKAGEMFVPEVMLSARVISEGMKLVKPLLDEADITSAGTVVIGTVAGDLHDIGKNLVIMMLESAGFKVIDLGINIVPEIFIEAIKTHQPDILGLSALLTTTLPEMKKTIEAIKQAGVRDMVKIMVGGAPVTQEYADEIGADGFCIDAMAAREMFLEVVKNKAA